MERNPRTWKVKTHLSDDTIRLSQDDRQFLRDLARVQYISEDIAREQHYQDRKTAPKLRLDKLVEAGLLKRHTMHEYGKGKLAVYEFANDALAKSWGGKRSVFGSNRTLQHEVITSRLYFSLNRPADFRKENQFTAKDKQFISRRSNGDHDYKPDALFTVSPGEVCFVEADSGQYSKAQIIKKQVAWQDVRQVWGQPRNAAARIHSGGPVRVFHY
jgi:hypothetical protein